jgi:hypothetical protein
MPLALNQLLTSEVIIHGSVASAGSNARVFDVVTHWKRTAVTFDPVETQVNAAVITNIVAPLMAALNVRATMQYVSTRFMEDPTRRAVRTSDTTAGAQTGDSMVMDDCAYLLINTPLRGRSYRGSKHLYPISESDTTTTGDVLNSGALTRFGTLAAALLAGFTDANGNIWNPVLYSRKLSNPTRLPLALITTTGISSISVRKSVGDMKSRRPVSVY